MYMESVVISVRVKTAVKKKLEEEGIDVQNEVRMFLNQKASQIGLKEALDRMGLHPIIHNRR